MRRHLVRDGNIYGGGYAILGKIPAQLFVLICGRFQIVRGFFQSVLLERQKTGKVSAISQMNGFPQVFKSRPFVAKGQLPAPVYQSFLIARRDKALEETQCKSVFRADCWDVRSGERLAFPALDLLLGNVAV